MTGEPAHLLGVVRLHEQLRLVALLRVELQDLASSRAHEESAGLRVLTDTLGQRQDGLDILGSEVVLPLHTEATIRLQGPGNDEAVPPSRDEASSRGPVMHRVDS